MSQKKVKEERKIRQIINEQAVVLFLEILNQPLRKRIKFAWQMLIGKRRD